MTGELRFPLRLESVLFKSLNFSRAPEIPDSLQLNINAEIKVHDDKFPDSLQVNIKVETPEGQPLMLCVELVGLFRLVEDQPRPDRSVIPTFVNERALYALMPYIIQMIRIVTGQMGMNPINVPIPFAFDYRPSEKSTDSGKA